jgi:N utilization substance protein B
MDEPDKPSGKRPAKRSLSRSQARLAAVQALYQMDATQIDLNDVIAEFSNHRFDKETDGATLSDADQPFFAEVLRGVVREQQHIDALIRDHLASGWRLSRLDSILRAILRAGAYELFARADIPPKVVINEYVEVTHAFFDGEEPGAVNGILDRLARKLRAGALPDVTT